MIYLDHNATTPIRPQVIDLMTSIMAETGNASSTHAAGRSASMHIERARERIASALNTRPAQVIFTSCATESMSTIIKTFKDDRILVGATEHPAILECGLSNLETIKVHPDGTLDLDHLETLMQSSPTPKLVCMMMVNNETGVIHPIKQAIDIVHRHGGLVHVDAVQAMGKMPIDFKELGADYLSLSAHKIGGPQGVGCFIFAAQKPIRPLLYGGKQEKRQRAGTSNVAGIAGMGLAVEMAAQSISDMQELSALRNDIESRLQSHFPDIVINGQSAPRASTTSSITFPGIDNNIQLMNLDLEKICVSSGSACSSGVSKPSATLRAMGLGDKDATSTIRVSLGWTTTKDDIDGFVNAYIKTMERLAR